MNDAPDHPFVKLAARALLLCCAVLAVASAGLVGRSGATRADPAQATMKGNVILRDPRSQSAAESVLLSVPDLGAGWKTMEQLAAENGATVPQLPYDVPTASVDPGIEDPDRRCGVAQLVGMPDGVKLAAASSTLFSESNGAMITASAAVFPAEDNASARFDAYVAAMRGCPDELRIGIDDTNAPPGLRTTIEVEELDLPPGAFGLRTSTGMGALDFGKSSFVDVVMRQGRMIAGIYVMNFAGQPETLDVAALSGLMIQRLEAAMALLPEAASAVPVFSPHAASEEAASAALTTAEDYPAAWSAPPIPESPITIEPGGGVVPVPIASGSGRMFIRSSSPNCSASQLAPAPGMLARAGTGLMRVGRDHYVWHYAAVFEHEDGARDAAAKVVEASKRCDEENASGRSPDADITWEPVSLGVTLSEVTYLSAGFQRWHIEGHAGFPALDDVTTTMLAVLRRGRLLATFELSVTGEDLSAARDALETAVAKLTRAEALLR